MFLKGIALAALATLIAAPAYAQDGNPFEDPYADDTGIDETLIEREPARDELLDEQELEEAVEEEAERAVEEEVEETAVPAETVVLRPEPVRVRDQANVALELEGGYSRFTDNLNTAVSPGGNWGLRGVFGTSSPIGVELGYFGSANNYEVGDGSAISTAGEVLGRVNFLKPESVVQPFLAAGVNYFRMDSTEDQGLSGLFDDQGGILDNAESIGFPLSAGLAFYPSQNFVIGARGTYRILTDWIDDNFPDGDNWNAGLTLGAAF